MRPKVHPSVLLAAVFIFSVPGTARTWTDTQGRTLDASLVKSSDSEVTLQLDSNHKVVTLPLSRLSQADVDFIKSESKKSTAGDKTSAPDSELNFEAPWPKAIHFDEDPEIQTVEEDKEKKHFVYESTNYRFTSDVRLAQSVVKGFAVMFESTYLYCRALPLAISGGGKTAGKYQILLFESHDDYVKAGGPPSSAGVFVSGKNVVMVPLTSLGVRQMGSGYILDRDKANGTLVHELTHQLTPESYFKAGALGWFSEGLAEYATATPYRAGVFKVKSNFDDIVAYATAYGKDSTHGRALGEKIKAPALKDFLTMSYAQFAGPSGNFNYGFGLLLTTYFLHLDGEGDGSRIKQFLMALRAGKSGQDALAILLDGRSYKQLEDDISKAWKKKRVDIEFAGASSSTTDDG
ncbi:SHD1 domain-containing protein [Haloferula sp. BvORR071]|uniref:SHD1 domain-containing protein n=1 Tax=Haloferula sp. BvORR071 TaxID=1396141 RepID=UPI0009464A69|nr:SHD1 domain-containing protein [Haloferula sp. BvORR071]